MGYTDIMYVCHWHTPRAACVESMRTPRRRRRYHVGLRDFFRLTVPQIGLMRRTQQRHRPATATHEDRAPSRGKIKAVVGATWCSEALYAIGATYPDDPPMRRAQGTATERSLSLLRPQRSSHIQGTHIA